MKDERPKRCICDANDLMPFGECVCGSVKSEALPPVPKKVFRLPTPADYLTHIGLKNLSELSVTRKSDNRVVFIAEIIEDYVKLLNKNK